MGYPKFLNIASILYLDLYMGSGYWFYLALLFACVLYGLTNYRILAIPYRRLAQLCFIDFFAEILSRTSYIYFENSYPVYYILIPITIVYQALIYISSYRSNSIQTKLRIWVALMLAAYVAVLLNAKSMFNFPSFGMMILSFSIILICLMSFYDMLNFPSDVSIYRQSLFWMNSANLIFYCTTFFIYGYFYYYRTPEWAYLLIGIFNIFLYSCYSLSFYLQVIEFRNGNKLDG
jgi:hypothetical protein